MAVKEPVVEPAFSISLQQSLYLTNNERICDGGCFQSQALTESDFSAFIMNSGLN